jgi:mannose-1-phosphate guanylyltransferase
MSSPTPTPTRYALILAGGSGQRFWPVSRDARPKQLLRLFGNKTLLELTVERLVGIVPYENILILTNSQQEAAVREVLPMLPAENVISEPEKRDTAPAIALGVGVVAARNPEATMMILPADHLINDHAAFRDVLMGAAEAAETSQALVTIGIKPTWPCPSYGYVERAGRAVLDGVRESAAVYEVARFREKPTTELAQHFLDQGTFTWNAGMFIWTVAAVRRELAAHAPALDTFIGRMQSSDDLAVTIKSEFPTLPKLSVDYALMEKSARVLNIEATFDWDDVGNWTSVGRYLGQDDQGNQHNVDLALHKAQRNIVFSQTGQQIALLGVDDLIIVAAGDAILVASKAEAESIKKIVDTLPASLR